MCLLAFWYLIYYSNAEKQKQTVDGPLIVKHDICEFTYKIKL